ncbi:MAG: RNA-binding cell elongation regulator Jag/EloR [Thermodesulfobacteriota bacterium]
MPVVIEKEGKTVSEAIISGCEALGVSREEVDVEVLDEGSKGVLGIGGKSARVKITVKRTDVSEKGLRAKKSLESILGFFVSTYSVLLGETSEVIKLDIKSGDETGLLIGRRGETLKAMEFIVGKIAWRFSENGMEKRISIDVEGYKKRREENIAKMVKEVAKKVRSSGRPITLDSMPASERKIAYIALKNEDGIRIETRGEGEEKRITINPLKRGGGGNQGAAHK